jgi:tetratricopeptide (TPR) repeat protein
MMVSAPFALVGDALEKRFSHGTAALLKSSFPGFPREGTRMRFGPPLMAMAIFVLAILCQPGFPAPAIPFREISGALSSGDSGTALGLANNALGMPGLAEADRARLVGERGLARNLQNDRSGALADLSEALGAKGLTPPERSRFYLEHGLILDGMDRLDEAAEDYTAALRLNPGWGPALNNRANVLRRQRRFEEARRDYLGSLAGDNPAPEYPYYGLGQIAESLGQPDRAKEYYRRAVAANPGYAPATERLLGLGGAPPPQQAIILKPPLLASGEDAPLILHLPAQKRPAGIAAMPDTVSSPPTIKPAAYSRQDDQPALRPALNNSEDNPHEQEIQLGAWRSDAEAAEGWNQTVREAGGALSGFVPKIVAVDLPGRGRYYRLRVETADASQLCAALGSRGLDCMRVRN